MLYPNRILREAGLLKVREEADGEHLDFAASRAWALVDHQFSHVFIQPGDAAAIDAGARTIYRPCRAWPRSAGDERARYHLDHERSGEVILISTPNSWQAYYWWLDDDKPPAFAKTVDIHRKPGYDPVELFFDPATRGIPLDANLVRGSHGAPAENENQRGVILSSQAGILGNQVLVDTQVFDIVLRQFGMLIGHSTGSSRRERESARQIRQPDSMKIHRRKFSGHSRRCKRFVARYTPPAGTGAEVTDEALVQAAEKPVLQKRHSKIRSSSNRSSCCAKATTILCASAPKTAPKAFRSTTAGWMCCIRFSTHRRAVLHRQRCPRFGRSSCSAFIARTAITNCRGWHCGCRWRWRNLRFSTCSGRINNQSLGELLGGVIRNDMQFYVASGRRDTTPEQEIDYLKSLIDKTGAKAIKYRVGGRMSRNADAMPGRTDNLIPLSRKALGDKMVIHADSNSSYDPPQAIEVGQDAGSASARSITKSRARSMISRPRKK